MSLHEVRSAAKEPPVCIENTTYPGEMPFTPPAEDEEFTLYVPYGSKDIFCRMGWDCFYKIEETDDFPSSGIDSVAIDGKEDTGDYYDLLGRKVETPTSGNIYIRNGKKYIIR